MLTKINYNQIKGAPVNVLDNGAYNDGTNSASTVAAIQAALNAMTSGGSLVLPFGTYDLGTVGITIPYHNIKIEGNNSVLLYSGSGHAVDAALVGGTIYPQFCIFNDFSVIASASCLSAFRWRFSYSMAKNVSAIVTASTSTAWRIDTDFVNGSGPYYNQFDNCHATGKVGVTVGVANQTGWLFTTYATYASRGPNANVFVGGRTTSFNNPYVIAGTQNRIIGPTIEGTASGAYVLTFQNAYGGGAGCSYNEVLYPYVEGPTGYNFILFGTNAEYNHVSRPYITGLGSGSDVTDTSGNGTNTIEDYSGYQFSNNPTTDNRTLNWYERGAFTPVLSGQSVAGVQTYSVQKGRFTRMGNRVTINLDIELTAFDAATAGYLKITGLPYPASTASDSTVSVLTANAALSLSAGNTWIVGRIDPGSSFAWLIQNGSGLTPTLLSASALLSGTVVSLTGSYETL